MKTYALTFRYLAFLIDVKISLFNGSINNLSSHHLLDPVQLRLFLRDWLNC